MLCSVLCLGYRCASLLAQILAFVFLPYLAFLARLESAKGSTINWDTGIFYSGAYRIYLGQAPHVDYSQITGSVVSYIGVPGFLFVGPSSFGYELGVAIFCSIVIGICQLYYIGLGKLAGLSTIRIVAFTALATICSAPIICSSTILSYGDAKALTGYYCKVGQYALLQLVVGWLFLTRAYPSPVLNFGRRTTQACVASCYGLLWVMACTSKISYAALGSAVAASLPLILFVRQFFREVRSSELLDDKVAYLKFLSRAFRAWCGCNSWLAFFFLLAPVGLLAHWDFNISALFQDLRIAISARPSQTVAQAFQNLSSNWWFYPSLIIPIIIAVQREYLVALAITGWFLLSSPFLAFATSQPPFFEDYALVLLPAGLAFIFMREPMTIPRRIGSMTWGVALVVMAVVFGHPHGQRDFWHSVSQVKILEPRVVLSDSRKTMRRLDRQFALPVFADTDSLLRRCKGLRKGSLLFVDAPDTYSVVRKLPLRHNTPLYWHYGVTFNETDPYFNRDDLFSGVTLVAIPAEVHYPTVTTFRAMFGGYLDRFPKGSAGSSEFYYLGRDGHIADCIKRTSAPE